MKIKMVIISSLIAITVFLIYLTTGDYQVYYLNLSIDNTNNSYDTYVKDYLEGKDKLEKYINSFVDSDDRVTDLIHKIEENSFVTIDNKKQTIKNALIKADLVTVFIGLNDINYKIGYSNMNDLYNYGDSFLKDVNHLLYLLNEYCKEDIVIIGYYNKEGSYYDEYFDYLNRELENLAIEYDMTYISLDDIYNFEDHYDNKNLKEEEYKSISNKIIEFINKKIL